MKRAISVIIAVFIIIGSFSGCASGGDKVKKETRSFTDSAGREVQVPVEVDSIVPSGSLAQMILYTVCPDKLISLSSAFTRTQKKYIDEKYWDLPVTGQFYGGGSTVNYEEIIKYAPDVIIDMGEAKSGIVDDMDEIQSKTGIPVVFIQADMDTMAEAYDMLAELTGDTAQAEECAKYIRSTMDKAESIVSQIPENEKKRVLYSQGEYGTEVLGKGSVHAQTLDCAGAVNVAVLDDVSSKGGNEVSMEQIMLWNPDVVILSPDANYDEIFDDPDWQEVKAVKDLQVYEVPEGPYNWLDRPPSVQRVLGVIWLGNLLYPELFDYDMTKETENFYSLFFHYQLSDDEASELMANSTYSR